MAGRAGQGRIHKAYETSSEDLLAPAGIVCDICETSRGSTWSTVSVSVSVLVGSAMDGSTTDDVAVAVRSMSSSDQAQFTGVY